MEHIWKVEKTNNEGTVYFHHTSTKSEFAKIEIFDITTQTLIYFDEKEWANSTSYWISPGFVSEYSGNVIFRVTNKEGEIVFEHPYEHKGERRLPVINGKPIYFKSNKNDTTYQNLVEVFFKLDYQGDFCKINVNDTVVDVGGNVGIFTAFAQQMKPKHTFVVEPMGETFKYLTENLSNFKNITLINKAISKNGGDMEFLSANHSGCSILKDNLEGDGRVIFNGSKSVTVKTTTINNLIKEYNINYIDFLKVDCEGGEKDLFETIDKNYLENNINKIILEYHSHEIRELLTTILINCGFVIERKDDNSIGMIYAYNPNFNPQL